MQEPALQSYPIWDRTVRIFHWVSVVCILVLVMIGLMLMFSDAFKLQDDSKVVLKTLHVSVGYIFAVTLIWRLIWAFVGSRSARWRAVLPVGKIYRAQFRAEMQGRKIKQPVRFLGHSPVARIMISALLLLMTAQAVSGLVLSSTFYMPPFGQQIKTWIAEDPSKLDEIQPYSKQNIDPQAYKEMRAWRKPFRVAHEWIFYALMLLIPLHIAAAVYVDSRHRNGVISAMFSGQKVFKDKPFDAD